MSTMQINSRLLTKGSDCERIRLLSNYGWLSETTSEFSEGVIAAGIWKRLERDTRLFKAGDFAGDLFGLAEGVVAITSEVGFDTLVHVVRPPTWIGWQILIGDRRRRYTATMKTAGWVLRVPKRELVTLLNRDRCGLPALMPLVTRYNELTATAANDLLIRNSEQRVIAVLLRFSGHGDLAGGPELRAVPITQHELADATNLSRNTIISILQGLEARDVIKLGKGSVVVQDAIALAALLSKTSGAEAPVGCEIAGEKVRRHLGGNVQQAPYQEAIASTLP